MKKISFFVLAAILLVPVATKAQGKFSVGADLVSSYVWRGSYCAGASFQPKLGFSAGGFSIGAWGSSDFSLGLKEVDLAASYSLGVFTFGVTDYWWNGEGAYDYFQLFEKDANSHLLELNLTLLLESGFSLAWNTMLAGAQDKYADSDGKLQRAFSTYVEAGYSFSAGDVNLTASLGVSPWKSDVLYTSGYQYATDGFAITNIGLKAAKDIAISEKFSLPVFGQISWNPAKEDVFLVFGLSF